MLLVPTRIGASTIHGIGVFAAASIKAGHAVWRFVPDFDRAIDPAAVERFPEHARAFCAHYGYLDRNVKRIVLCFDDARFVNHSHTPNLHTDYTLDAYGLDVALRDIEAGEELTMDYGEFEENAERAL